MPNAKRGNGDWSRGLSVRRRSYSWEWCVGRFTMKGGVGWGRRRFVRATFYNPTKCEKRARTSQWASVILIEIGFCAEKSSYLERMKWVHLRHDERPISIADLYEARSNRTVRFVSLVRTSKRFVASDEILDCVYVDTHTCCSTITECQFLCACIAPCFYRQTDRARNDFQLDSRWYEKGE